MVVPNFQSFSKMPKRQLVSCRPMQVLARLNAIAEDDSGDEEDECGPEISDQDTSTTLDQGQSLDENALSDVSDSDTDTDALEHIDFPPRQFASSNGLKVRTLLVTYR